MYTYLLVMVRVVMVKMTTHAPSLVNGGGDYSLGNGAILQGILPPLMCCV